MRTFFSLWQWPGPCRYVPICTPAFSPATSHREEGEGSVIPPEAMSTLCKLHSESPSAGAAPLAVPVPIVANADDPLVVSEPLTSRSYDRGAENRLADELLEASAKREHGQDAWTEEAYRSPPVRKEPAMMKLSGGNLVAALSVSALAGAILSAAFVRR